MTESTSSVPSSAQTPLTSLVLDEDKTVERLEKKLDQESWLGNLLVRIRWKRIMQVIFDSALVAVGFAMAYLIRFDGHVTDLYLHQLATLVPLVVLLQLASNWTLGVYRRLWRYTGLTEVMELGLSVLTVTTCFLVARALGWLSVDNNHLSYGIIFVNAGISFLSLVGPRVFRRLMTEHSQRRHWRQPVRKRVLVVGAGEAGLMVLREMNLRSDGVDIVGLIDDDPAKVRKRIGAITVFGTTSELPKFIENLFIDQVIIAMPSAPPSETRRIVEMCRQAEVETRILPGLYELIDGKVSINQLREVSLEDLLGRDPVKLDNQSISSYIAGRSVLVTGAGGSIGSELCRQIVRYRPSRLILLGKGENSIFTIQQELIARKIEGIEISAVIADVRENQRMTGVFEQFKPEVVFHAAAHKHVPLMESNVSEAVANNVFGTKCVAELSAAHGVKTFVLVSSDKAVNPTSVMGATKRTAELVVQNLAQVTETKYVAVRFGNVLASRGSVIPLWKQQISKGGPITVTHPEATRYFMLIPEAVQLILQAGALGNGGEIFVLDMGNPVKILDLANDLIRFSGLSPGVDIDIEFVGLRPGEKLYEELLTKEEGLTKTVYEKIFVGQPQPIDRQSLQNSIDRLKQGSIAGNDAILRDELDGLVGGCLKQKQSTEKSV